MGELGLRLGDIDLASCIGRGGMGQVWRGVHRSSDTLVAVKILDADAVLRPGFSEAFRDEARVVASLQHPHIVMVHELGIIPEEVAEQSMGRLIAESPFLVMEYAHEGTLGSMLPTLSWAGLAQVLFRLLDALAHAHARGVIHLDVKPANLLLGCGRPETLADGVRLTDFGLAWQERSPGRVGRRAKLGGTLGRMAPEQIQASWRSYGPWTDLYAVGAMVWQYATGTKPFTGSTRASMLVGPLMQDLPDFVPMRPVPIGLEAWLRVLMAREPTSRFMLAADAAHALRQIASGPTTGDRPTAMLLWDPDSPTDVLSSPAPPAPSPPSSSTVLAEVTDVPRWSQDAQVPPDWRGADFVRSGPVLRNLGLGLFGLRTIPFIGREAERDQLWDALRDAASGPARVILLRGVAGVGKSRLASWLGQRAHEVGAIGAFIRVEHAADNTNPHSGLRSALARHLGCVDLDLPGAEKHLKRVLSWWSTAPPWLAPSLARWLLPASEPPAEQPAVLLAALLRAMGQNRPLVLWLDEVQWDLESLDSLNYLMSLQAAEPLPLLVLLTASEESLAEHPEAAELLSQITMTTLTVGPLEPPEDELLVRALTGLEPELAAQLAERCQGNPLLAVHIISDWIARGILRASSDGFRLLSSPARIASGPSRLPDQIRSLWQERLARLSDQIGPPATEALELAAVLGTEIKTAEWCALLGGWSPAALIDALLRARLARPLPRGWAFIHNMLREVLLDQARRAGRLSRHHRACARLLASVRTPELQERLGLHLLHAGDHRMAFAHLMSAARTLDQRGISRAASRVVTTAAAALDQLDVPREDRRRCACQILRAQIEIRRHDPRRWLDEMAAMRDIAQQQGWRELEAEALWVLGEAYQKSDRLDEARTCLESGLALSVTLQLPRLHQEILVALALMRLRRSDQEGARPLLLQVLGMPVLSDAPTVQLVALLNLASIARIMGQLEDAERYAQDAIARGQARGCLDIVSHGHLIMGAIADRRGNLGASADHLQESLRIVRRTGKFRAISLTLNSIGEIARRQQRLDAAERAYLSSLSWAEASGRPLEPPQINLALVRIRQQRFSEAHQMLEEVRQQMHQLGERFVSWHCQAFMLSALAGMGDWAGFDHNLAAVLAEEDGQKHINEDIAEEAALAGEYALQAGHTQRALAAWRLSRAHWAGLQRQQRIDAITLQIQALEDAS